MARTRFGSEPGESVTSPQVARHARRADGPSKPWLRASVAPDLGNGTTELLDVCRGATLLVTDVGLSEVLSVFGPRADLRFEPFSLFELFAREPARVVRHNPGDPIELRVPLASALGRRASVQGRLHRPARDLDLGAELEVRIGPVHERECVGFRKQGHEVFAIDGFYTCAADDCDFETSSITEAKRHQRSGGRVAPHVNQPAALVPSVPEIAPATSEMKTCPDCAEEVRAAARKCRFCGYMFAESAEVSG
jgi:hypothetical protein